MQRGREMDEKNFINQNVFWQGKEYKISDCKKKNINNSSDFLILLSANNKKISVRQAILNNGMIFVDTAFHEEVKRFIATETVPIITSPKLLLDPPSGLTYAVISIYKNNATKRNISDRYGTFENGLEKGKIYGAKALDIYEKCCFYYGFDYAKSHYFDLQQILFATNVTKEGYCAWFLPNSDLLGNTNKSGTWVNVYRDDIIYELWRVPDDEVLGDRITFIKQKDGSYVFVGIYRLEKLEEINDYIDDEKRIYITVKKTYKRVADNYL